MNPTPGPMPLEWFWWIIAAVVTFSGVGVMIWALLWDRARGRKRCPKCWYDMAGAEPRDHDGKQVRRCPECGTVIFREKKLHKTRRRWKWAAVGVIVLLTPAGLLAYKASTIGYWQAIPDRTLVWIVQAQGWPEPSRSWTATAGALPRVPKDELYRRLNDGLLLPCTVERIIRTAMDRAIITRDQWPIGVPLEMTMTVPDWCRIGLKGSMRIYSEKTALNHSAPGAYVGYSYFTASNTSISSHNSGWRSLNLPAYYVEPVAFRPQFDGNAPSYKVQIHLESNPAAGRANWTIWTGWIRPNVEGVESVNDVITPVNDRELTGQFKQIMRFDRGGKVAHPLRVALRIGSIGGDSESGETTVGLRIRDEEVSDLAVGLRLEVRRGPEVVATARGLLKYAKLFPAGYCGFVFDADDPSWLEYDDFSDPAWTLHIIGDGEMALRDFDKTKYWAGEFSIPMSEVEIRRTQR